MRFNPAAEDYKLEDAGIESYILYETWTLAYPAIKDRDFIIRFNEDWKSIENLADTMRKGGLYPKQDSAARALVTRGLISPQQPVTEEEINLLMGR